MIELCRFSIGEQVLNPGPISVGMEHQNGLNYLRLTVRNHNTGTFANVGFLIGEDSVIEDDDVVAGLRALADSIERKTNAKD